MSYEIDYKIFGQDMQIVEIELDPGETVIAEAGAMMFMESSIEMKTIFGDGSDKNQAGGFMGKLLGAGKRLLTGESLFMTAYTNAGAGKQKAVFAAPHPGQIIPINLAGYQDKIICQRDSFLCAAQGVAIGVEFTQKFGAGVFGGEGFILQKLEGDGMVFVHAGGTIVKKELEAGELLRVDTGCLVAFTRDVHYDIQMAKGIKSALFGGEGLFLATVSGPGTVWLQSIPFSRLADKIIQAIPKKQEE
ncbi:TIGR00266 family protein [Anaerospora hongkongensis]|uniref:TIGR00266 family protein n=1 Tax=Anaerospora hongkongensis TaxID=244830 RepID=UPI002FDA65FE